jgi:trans-aconitate 2-methyltransferase
MPEWDSAQYLKFQDERTQPCRDLAARVALDSPASVIDLGCGPGNSTEVVAGRWPHARITGLDSSAAMIAAAKEKYRFRRWVAGEIADWAAGPQTYDLVFSNAALQWVPDHANVFPQLLDRVAPGGALAVQMPGNWDAIAHRLMREIAPRFGIAEHVREWYTHQPEFYYDTIAPHARRLDLWITEYMHVLDGAEGIVEWYRGTGMRPFLEALPNDTERSRFTAEYLDAVRDAYPPRANGRVLFAFRRIFLIAYR